MVVIELGQLGTGEVPDAPPGRVLPNRARRGLAAAATAALVLATTLASGPPVPPTSSLGSPLWAVEGAADFGIGASNVYVSTPEGTVAYDGATGARRWVRPGDRLYFDREVAGLAILVEGQQMDQEGEGVRTLVLDTETGAQRLHYPALPVGVTADRQGVLLFRPSRQCAGVEACTVLLGVRLDTGAPAWRREISAFASSTVDVADDTGLIRRLLIVDGQGLAQVWDAGTGAVTASIPVPVPTADRPVHVATLDDSFSTLARETTLSFVVATGATGQVLLARYPAGAADPVWTVALGPNANLGRGFYVGTLADVVVVSRGSLMTVLDAGTGARRFDRVADGLMDLGEGRLLAQEYAGLGSLVATIVDAATGVTVITLTGSDVFAVGESPGRVLLVGLEDPGVVVRMVDRNGRIWLSDVVAGSEVTCRARGRLLACANAAGRLRVWELPAP